MIIDLKLKVKKTIIVKNKMAMNVNDACSSAVMLFNQHALRCQTNGEDLDKLGMGIFGKI